MKVIGHTFVEKIPSDLEENVLYISIKHRCAIHKCFCGCKEKIVLPFSPTEWTLEFHGNSVSLDPSIGNWSYPCKSHYWIKKNRVYMAAQWSKKQIEKNRKKDKKRRFIHSILKKFGRK